MGCHSSNLAIKTGRWHGTPRMQRLCHRCPQGALDDERHLVFECLTFGDLRKKHRQLFESEVAFDMCRFFADKDQHGVVMYILGCLHLLEQTEIQQ